MSRNYDGLDLDPNPDTFETGADKPEGVVDDEKEKDVPDISRDKLGAPKQTYKKFAGHDLDLRRVDYSDRIGRPRGPIIPYTPLSVAGLTDYEMNQLRPEEPETTMQRFLRLSHEVQDLTVEVEAKAKGGDNGIDPKVSTAQLQAHLQGLSKQLALLASNEQTQGFVDPEASVKQMINRQGDVTKRLVSELKGFTSSGSSADAAAAAPATSTTTADTVTYSLYYNPDHTRYAHLAKVAQVERRLAELEKLVGAVDLDAKTDLQAAVLQLDKKLTMLDDDKVKQVQRRLMNVTKTLDEVIQKKKDMPVSSEVEKKVGEIFEKMDRWDSVATLLPALIDRLRALRDVHSEAANFSARIGALDSSSVALKDALAAQAGLLARMETSMTTNMGAIERNVTNIEERITRLDANLATLK